MTRSLFAATALAILVLAGQASAAVVQAHLFLIGDPAKGGAIDFAGLSAPWSRSN